MHGKVQTMQWSANMDVTEARHVLHLLIFLIRSIWRLVKLLCGVRDYSMNISFSVGDETSVKAVPFLASRGSPKLFAVKEKLESKECLLFRCSRRWASLFEVTPFREDKEHRHSLVSPFPAAQGGTSLWTVFASCSSLWRSLFQDDRTNLLPLLFLDLPSAAS